MSDRRAVTAGRLAAPSVASEMWRVAVGGNRVENMTVQEIAHAYQSGHLNERTPLWPPGTSGWQALGNFQQFQYASGAHSAMAAEAYQGGHYHQGGQHPQGQYQQLSQFQEGDDDPTRMWTGAGDLEMDMPAPMPVATVQSTPPMSAQPMSAQPARPSARTGPRHVSSPAPRPMSAPPMRAVSSAPTASPSVPPFRAKRSSGWLLVAGLVGLVGLGSAVLAARGNWTSAAIMDRFSSAPAPEATAAAAPAAAAPAPAAAEPASPAAAAAEPSAAGEAAAPGVNGVAKYEESGASAFVAGAEPGKAAAGEAGAEGEKPADPAAANDDAKAEDDTSIASTTKGGRRSRSAKEGSKSQPAPKRSLSSKASSTQNAKRATAALTTKSKPEASESEDAPPASSTPASPSVNEAAATALANSAKLASSCRPRGGPSGAGKARIIYSQDGEVQSVEILTAKFRDTLTGSCVRMVFRRAKIPPFKGEPPTFIKSFTIPEE